MTVSALAGTCEHPDELSDVLDALPFDHAEFRELAPKGVRNARPLVDQQLPGGRQTAIFLSPVTFARGRPGMCVKIRSAGAEPWAKARELASVGLTSIWAESHQ
jgi:hypothetical protein